MPALATGLLERTRVDGAADRARDPNTPSAPDSAAALPAFRQYRPRPGHPDWHRLQEDALGRACRLRPTLERPRSGGPERRRRLASYATAARNYLANRRLVHAGRGDLRPLYFIWTVLRTCNFRCTYCDDHRGQRYPELPKDGTLTTAQGHALLRIMRTRAPSVYFSGGDPLLRKDRPELTRAARDRGSAEPIATGRRTTPPTRTRTGCCTP